MLKKCGVELFFLFNIFFCVLATEINHANLDHIAALKEKMQYKEAIKLLTSLRSSKKLFEEKKLLAKLYYLDGDIGNAYKIFKKFPNKDWEIFLYLGLIFEEKGYYKLAISNYLESIKLNENTISLYRIGKIYFKQKEYLKAKDFFMRVIQNDASFRLANYYLAECFIKLGDYKKAYSQISKTFQFYPQNQKVKNRLFEVKAKLGDKFFAQIKKTIEKTRRLTKLPIYRRLTNIPTIKVGIAKNLTQITLRCGGEFVITDGLQTFNAKEGNFYTFVIKQNFVFLRDYYTGQIYKKFKLPLDIKSNFPFYILNLTYGKDNYWSKTIDRIFRGDFRLINLNNLITLVNIISIEEYLYGVLPAEIPANSPIETLKTQAVIARTIAFKSLGKHKMEGFDICSDIHCQVYQGLSAETPQTNRAVDLTKGEILVDKNNKAIEALYHSNCGGCLRRDAFNKDLNLENKFDTKNQIFNIKNPKMLSSYFEDRWFIDKPPTFCANEDGKFRWQRVYDAEDFYLAFGFDISELDSIIPIKKGECFHYDAIKIQKNNKELILEGDLKIRNYFDQLRSNAIKFELHKAKNKNSKLLFIWGAGFGHGQGLCQSGAIYMGKQYNYKKILEHYYPNARLKNIY
ncbi:MAG: SpoIID/LytB domain-containing protein [Candidatus Omnitrophica bacterium]|nr:SpoIID/LytB domain-containing protein [Candidatus Omnitrophota bacterium]